MPVTAPQFQALQPGNIFRAFSGSNIYATIGERQVATLQSVTVSITREVAALYSFGDSNPKAFVRGKRGIAGTLVFTQYDRHALLRDIFADLAHGTLGESGANFLSQFHPLDVTTPLLGQPYVQTRNFSEQLFFNGGLVSSAGISNLDDSGELGRELSTLYDFVANTQFRYTDQIPEFDIHITMINENGDAAFAAILGVLLVNEGWGYTLDDLTSESAFTYVAKAVSPLTPLKNNATDRYGHSTNFGKPSELSR